MCVFVIIPAFFMLTVQSAEAHELLSTAAGQHLCSTSLVIDEVRSQIAVKRNVWRAEGELAKLRLEGIQEAKKQQQEEQQRIQQQQEQEPEEGRRYVIRATKSIPGILS